VQLIRPVLGYTALRASLQLSRPSLRLSRTLLAPLSALQTRIMPSLPSPPTFVNYRDRQIRLRSARQGQPALLLEDKVGLRRTREEGKLELEQG
jgi:hypothetical protein